MCCTFCYSYSLNEYCFVVKKFKSQCQLVINRSSDCILPVVNKRRILRAKSRTCAGELKVKVQMPTLTDFRQAPVWLLTSPWRHDALHASSFGPEGQSAMSRASVGHKWPQNRCKRPYTVTTSGSAAPPLVATVRWASTVGHFSDSWWVCAQAAAAESSESLRIGATALINDLGWLWMAETALLQR